MAKLVENSVFAYSYFEHKHKVNQYNYVPYNEWLEENKMNAVLQELSKSYPETRFLYNKYLDHTIGWIHNKLHKQNIIQNYTSLTNSEFIIGVIKNFESYVRAIIDKHHIRTSKDKEILIFILNIYLKKATSLSVYNGLIDIINSIQTDIISTDPQQISYHLHNRLIHLYYPSIINDIIHFRMLEQIIQENHTN